MFDESEQGKHKLKINGKLSITQIEPIKCHNLRFPYQRTLVRSQAYPMKIVLIASDDCPIKRRSPASVSDSPMILVQYNNA